MEKKKIEFTIHRTMVCGSYEAEKRIYKMLVGKLGKRWLIAIQENSADNVYIEGGKSSDGFAGRTLNFYIRRWENYKLGSPLAL